MSESTTTKINTKNVTGRRKLHFSTLDEALADARQVAEHAKAGKVRQLGNWSPAQCLNHLSSWANYPFDGYPMKPSFFMKIVGRMIRGYVLTHPMRSGLNLPKAPGGTFAYEDGPIDQGL